MSIAKTISTECNFIYDEDSGERGQDGGNQENELSRRLTVGELVTQQPMRARVLEKYGIDYCCGGKVSLEDACRTKGLNVEEILASLIASDRERVQSDSPDWNTASLKSLIDHIISTYHQPLRQELSRVAQFAEKVSRVHGENHPEMIQVLNVFNRFKAQLELHIQKEEMVLFPAIASMEATGSPQFFGCGGGIEHPIEVMNQEHDDAGEALSTLRNLTHDYTPPEDACSTFC